MIWLKPFQQIFISGKKMLNLLSINKICIQPELRKLLSYFFCFVLFGRWINNNFVNSSSWLRLLCLYIQGVQSTVAGNFFFYLFKNKKQKIIANFTMSGESANQHVKSSRIRKRHVAIY